MSLFVFFIQRPSPHLPIQVNYLPCPLPASFSEHTPYFPFAVLQRGSSTCNLPVTLTRHSGLGPETPSPLGQVTARPFPCGPPTFPGAPQRRVGEHGRTQAGFYRLRRRPPLALLAVPGNADVGKSFPGRVRQDCTPPKMKGNLWDSHSTE